MAIEASNEEAESRLQSMQGVGVITFTPCSLHKSRCHHDTGHRYMDIETSVDGQYAGFFSGYVNDRVLAMVEAAPALLTLARQYASECSGCGGTGLVSKSYGGDGYGNRCAALADADDQPCTDCEDIRAVIAKATGE